MSDTKQIRYMGEEKEARVLAETEIAGSTIGVYQLVEWPERYLTRHQFGWAGGGESMSMRTDVRQAFTRMGEEVRLMLQKEKNDAGR